MKSLITALVAICLLASPVLAWSNIRMTYAGTGTSYMNELATIGGLDWSEGAGTNSPCDYVYPPVPQDTAYIHEVIINVGGISVAKEVRSTGAWELQEDKEVQGYGFTNIRKDVVWWTEDKKEIDGTLIYPTETNIYAEYAEWAPIPSGGMYPVFTDEVEFHNVADQPPAEDYYDQTYNTHSFSVGYTTNSDFTFMESVGINKDLRCDLDYPRPIRMPVCEWCI
jgi:hypothetical protein